MDFPHYLDKRSGRYECVSVIHHHGVQATAGHYTATCKTSHKGAYRHIDDDDVGARWAWKDVTRVQNQRTAHSLLFGRMTLSDDHGKVSQSSTLPYQVGAESQLMLP